jgi:hypothetical protein
MEGHPFTRLASVYVVVVNGDTFTLIVGAVPENGVPSDKVPESVPVPVTERFRVAVAPWQIVTAPARLAVGLGFTVILNGEPGALQPKLLATLTVPVYVPGAVLAGMLMVMLPAVRLASVTATKLFAGAASQTIL